MLEKNKNYIEFSMHSMVVTHKPYQVAGIEITGSNPDGRDFIFGNNPFDIPCNVVVIPKRDFEALQTKDTVIESYERYIEKWKTMTKCETPEAAATWITAYESACNRGDRLAREVEKWKEVTGCQKPEYVRKIKNLKDSDCECKTLVDIINELDQEIDKWQKATKRNSPEEAEKRIKLLVDDINVLMRVYDYLM